MPTIRVLLRDMPQILRDILENAISSQPDMALIDDPGDLPRPPGEVQRGPDLVPDAVIVGTTEFQHAQNASALLSRWPRSRILMIATSGHQAVLYELRPHTTELGELSPSDLVHAIRSAVLRGGDADRERPPSMNAASGNVATRNAATGRAATGNAATENAASRNAVSGNAATRDTAGGNAATGDAESGRW
jgi:hypothetical protein